MLMPKKHRTLIYEYLMKEGVVVAEKEFGLDKHPAIPVPNIHVIKALQVCLINLFIQKFDFFLVYI
jgi:small subunit ribosomal protein S10e